MLIDCCHSAAKEILLPDYLAVGTCALIGHIGIEEAVMQETCARDRQAADRVLKEMEQMQLQFPYTAAGMLSDPEKIQAYKQELTYRLHNAAAERERRSGRIREMMESVAAHG